MIRRCLKAFVFFHSACSDRPFQTQGSSKSLKRRRVVTGDSNDSEEEAPVLKSGVDQERLRWVRLLLSHPSSRAYTFEQLDALADEISKRNSLRKSPFI